MNRVVIGDFTVVSLGGINPYALVELMSSTGAMWRSFVPTNELAVLQVVAGVGLYGRARLVLESIPDEPTTEVTP